MTSVRKIPTNLIKRTTRDFTQEGLVIIAWSVIWIVIVLGVALIILEWSWIYRIFGA